MKFSIGDKVSFLNEKLSGTVSRIISEEICKVALEDGFEIDANVKELILISKAEVAEIPSITETASSEAPETNNIAAEIFDLAENDGIYFFSSPAEEMQVLTGPVKFFIVNKTNYQFLFSFSLKINNKAQGLRSGIVNPHSEIRLLNKKRSDMVDWQNFIFQGVLFNEEDHFIFSPLNKEVSLLLPDLKMEFPSIKSSASYSKSIKLMSTVQEEVNLEELKKKFIADEKKEEPAAKVIPQRKPPQQKPADTSAVLYNESEIDLHIQHLVEVYKDLSNSEMLQIQLKKFRTEMDHAIKNHYHKIIFIHGVGNGVLRGEILRELRNYTGILYRDAPVEKYGYGATEVILK